ncbi:MAG: hypothetical protein LBC54_00360 [Bacteroidales bacterium OttesenSCG-928-I14]|jgi:hypothetical protein|nr:hypothetical protein [Bacteroidales bacterium OttesenSCG-928-I14]
MKYLNFLILELILISNVVYSQKTHFTDAHYVETLVKVDTLIIPDKIYLKITLDEKDTNGKISIEELEKKMMSELAKLKINLHKNLYVTNISSFFIKNFLKPQNILKTKSYILLVNNEKTAMNTIIALKKENISNIFIEKSEYSKIEDIKLLLKIKAVAKAKENALALVATLNQKIGNAIFISDRSTFFQPKIYGEISNEISLINSNEFINIEFKKIKIETEVTVKFQLE